MDLFARPSCFPLSCVSCCGASLGCVLPWLFVFSVVLCRAVGCCCVFCRVSGCAVPLLCSRCGPLSCCGLRCRVLCCVPGCCAALCCRVFLRPVFCCCALRSVVSRFSVLPCVVSFPRALSVALRSCAFRRCVLPCHRALCALCCVCFCVDCWCVLLFAAVLCAVCVLGCHVVHFLSSSPCAVLCSAVLVPVRLAVCLVCAVFFLVLPKVVVCPAVSCGAVLCCCALCRVVLWPATLCCGPQRRCLAALMCGAGCCAASLSLGALLPCAVLHGAVLPCGAVVSCPAALFVLLCVLVRFL